MKILVLSDSHGNLDNMLQAAEREAPDRIFHLGDGWREAQRLHERFPDLPFHRVPGNCDVVSGVLTEQLVTLEGKRLLLCHGHTYHVKSSLIAAGCAAEENALDAFLFGHTHRPLVDRRGGTLFLNPGSIGDCLHPFYGIVIIEGDRLDGRTVPLLPSPR